MYIYQCYVTDPWKLCDDPVTVEKNVKKAWNPDSQTITVSTDSEAGSKENVHVSFYDKDDSLLGAVIIYFIAGIQYYIGQCRSYTRFSETLPKVTEKTWTITYNYTEETLVFHCNEVQVADVLLSACNYSGWRNYWGRKPTQIDFDSSDSASDTYCFSNNPGKYNGVIDSGE